MDIVTQAKNVGAVLGTASIVAYVCGYLALRARAFALGTDPAFKLVDEAYVFAGFRFVLITLIVLLVASPVALAVRWLASRLARSVPPPILQPSQWLLLVAVVIMTLLTLRILSVSGILLRDGPLSGSGLEGAVIGEAAGLRLLLTFAVVLLAAMSTFWLQARLAVAQGAFEWVLALTVALQFVVLPVYHGAFFADRRVRVLGMRPDSVRGLTSPLAIVDRTAEHATLLGLDARGDPGLTAVKLEDLNGIPVRRVVSLAEFVREVLTSDQKQEEASTPLSNRGVMMRASMVSTQEDEDTMLEKSEEAEKGFFSSLVEYLQITLDAIGSLGDSVVDSGELWVVDLDASGRPAGGKRRIGQLNDLSWPVAGPDGETYYALQRGRVVRVDSDGDVRQTLDEGAALSKLLGVLEDGTVLGLIRHEGEIRPAILRPGGRLLVGSSRLSNEDKAAVARLMQETRSNTGGWTLLVDRSERGGRGFDVFLRTGKDTFNISDCGPDSCGQASLSPSLDRAIFIRQPRY